MMNEEEINKLKEAMKGKNICWMDHGIIRRVLSISSHPDEPSDVAWLEGPPGGDYVALYNAKITQFAEVKLL